MNLQDLDTSTQLHGELFLSQPQLLQIEQTLSQILVLVNHLLHVRSLPLEGILHLLPLITFTDHLQERVSEHRPKTFEALPLFPEHLCGQAVDSLWQTHDAFLDLWELLSPWLTPPLQTSQACHLPLE